MIFTGARIMLGFVASVSKIGQAVAHFRKARRWTQGQLAMYSGVTSGYINLLERGGRKGNVRFDTVKKLATALEIPIEALTEYPTDLGADTVGAKESGPIHGNRETRLFKLLEQLTDEQLEALEIFVERLLAKGIGGE